MQWTIYLVYFISGLLIILFNKFLKIRASGHACGIVGPLVLATYFLGYQGIITGILIFVLVCWSSLKLKRHTLTQLLWGGLIPLIALLLTHFFLI
jgi:hypothetical protein